MARIYQYLSQSLWDAVNERYIGFESLIDDDDWLNDLDNNLSKLRTNMFDEQIHVPFYNPQFQFSSLDKTECADFNQCMYIQVCATLLDYFRALMLMYRYVKHDENKYIIHQEVLLFGRWLVYIGLITNTAIILALKELAYKLVKDNQQENILVWWKQFDHNVYIPEPVNFTSGSDTKTVVEVEMETLISDLFGLKLLRKNITNMPINNYVSYVLCNLRNSTHFICVPRATTQPIQPDFEVYSDKFNDAIEKQISALHKVIVPRIKQLLHYTTSNEPTKSSSLKKPKTKQNDSIQSAFIAHVKSLYKTKEEQLAYISGLLA